MIRNLRGNSRLVKACRRPAGTKTADVYATGENVLVEVAGLQQMSADTMEFDTKMNLN
jgi:hypothetical protein